MYICKSKQRYHTACEVSPLTAVLNPQPIVAILKPKDRPEAKDIATEDVAHLVFASHIGRLHCEARGYNPPIFLCGIANHHVRRLFHISSTKDPSQQRTISSSALPSRSPLTDTISSSAPFTIWNSFITKPDGAPLVEPPPLFGGGVIMRPFAMVGSAML